MSVKNNYPNVRPSIGVNFARSKKIPSSINYSRPSTGTYVGADGLIKLAGVNEPRFDHNPTTGEILGLLVEEARTNSTLHSQNLSNASWSKSNCNSTSNNAIAPDGTLTATKITTEANDGGVVVNQNYTATQNPVSFTYSIFAKAGTYRYIGIQGFVNVWSNTTVFDLQTGTIFTPSNFIGTKIAQIVSYGNGWYRCSVTYPAYYYYYFNFQFALTSYVGSSDYGIYGIYVNNVSPTAGQFIYVWGAQLEAGAFPTSYIPTTSATVTRNADTLTVPSSILNPSKFSIRIETESAVNKAPAFSLNNGTAFNETKLLLYPTAGGSRLIQNGNIVRDGLVLNLDVGNPASYLSGSGYYYRAWSGGWSGSLATSAANSFDGNLSTDTRQSGTATYTFSGGLNVSGTVRVYVFFNASSGQVNGRTGVILVDGTDISSKMAAANLYGTAGWVDVTSEVGSIFNTIVLNGTGGSTNPGIFAIEVNGQILIDNTTLIDLSGNGNNGTLTNGPTYSSANGGSIVFDGVNDYVNAPLTKSATCTFSCWAKTTTLAGLLMLFNAGPSGSGPDLVFYNGSISWNTWDGDGNLFVTTPASVTDGNYHYYVVVNDASSNTKLYYDGVLLGTAVYKSAAANTNLTIGGNTNTYMWNGNISNFTIYNRALSAAEVSQNYNATRGRFGI